MAQCYVGYGVNCASENTYTYFYVTESIGLTTEGVVSPCVYNILLNGVNTGVGEISYQFVKIPYIPNLIQVPAAYQVGGTNCFEGVCCSGRPPCPGPSKPAGPAVPMLPVGRTPMVCHLR
jgi:hypothetical protein